MADGAVQMQQPSTFIFNGKQEQAGESQEADSNERDGNSMEEKRDSLDKQRENGKDVRSDSFTKKIKASWKDSLSLRKDKMKDKRQPSISNLNMLPPSEDELQKIDKTGSLSKRIGRAVISSVNKLRRKPPKDAAKDGEQDNSDDSQGSDDEGGAGGGGVDGESEPRSSENPNTNMTVNTNNLDNNASNNNNNNNNEDSVNNENEDEDDREEFEASAKRASSMPNLNSPELLTPIQPRRSSDPQVTLVLVSCMRKDGKEKSAMERAIKFNEIVTVRRTWAKKDYDRKGEVTWKLTPDKAVEIRNELNEFKKEMDIHEESRSNTHFY